jgi:hypothetical protein
MAVLPPPGDASRVSCFLADHPQWSVSWDKKHGGFGGSVARHVRLGGECGVNAYLKIPCLVAGMAASAHSIDDMSRLRHGALPCSSAPSTLGSHLRSFI